MTVNWSGGNINCLKWHLAVNSMYVECKHTATLLKGLTDQHQI